MCAEQPERQQPIRSLEKHHTATCGPLVTAGARQAPGDPEAAYLRRHAQTGSCILGLHTGRVPVRVLTLGWRLRLNSIFPPWSVNQKHPGGLSFSLCCWPGSRDIAEPHRHRSGLASGDGGDHGATRAGAGLRARVYPVGSVFPALKLSVHVANVSVRCVTLTKLLGGPQAGVKDRRDCTQGHPQQSAYSLATIRLTPCTSRELTE